MPRRRIFSSQARPNSFSLHVTIKTWRSSDKLANMPSQLPTRPHLLDIPLEIRLRIYDLLFADVSLYISAFSRQKTLGEQLPEPLLCCRYITAQYSEQSRFPICKVHASLTGLAVLLTCRQMRMETPSLLTLCQTLVLQAYEINNNKTFLPILLASLAYSWSPLHPALSGIRDITTLVLEHVVASGLWEAMRSSDLYDSPRRSGSHREHCQLPGHHWHDLLYLLKSYENIRQVVLRWRHGTEFQDILFSRAQCLDTYYSDTAQLSGTFVMLICTND